MVKNTHKQPDVLSNRNRADYVGFPYTFWLIHAILLNNEVVIDLYNNSLGHLWMP